MYWSYDTCWHDSQCCVVPVSIHVTWLIYRALASAVEVNTGLKRIMNPVHHQMKGCLPQVLFSQCYFLRNNEFSKNSAIVPKRLVSIHINEVKKLC